MHVSYKLTEGDLLEAQIQHGGVWRKVLPVVGFPLIAIGLASAVIPPRQYSNAVVLISIGLILSFGLRLQVRSSFRKDKRLHEQFEADVTESGIEISSSRGNSNYHWNSFTRYVESKRLFLVYQAPQLFNVFPKRAFASADLDSFRSLLQAKLGSASTAHHKKIDPRTWIFLAAIAVSAILLVMAIGNIR